MARKQTLIHLHTDKTDEKGALTGFKEIAKKGELGVKHSSEETAILTLGNDGEVKKFITDTAVKTLITNAISKSEGTTNSTIKGIQETIATHTSDIATNKQDIANEVAARGEAIDTVNASISSNRREVDTAIKKVSDGLAGTNSAVGANTASINTLNAALGGNLLTANAVPDAINDSRTIVNAKSSGHVKVESTLTGGTHYEVTVTENDIASAALLGTARDGAGVTDTAFGKIAGVSDLLSSYKESNDTRVLTIETSIGEDSKEGTIKGRIKANEDAIAGLSSATHFIGISDTPIADKDAATTPINTDKFPKSEGKKHTPVEGDIVIYLQKEFVASGNPLKWHELGDTSAESGRITEVDEKLTALTETVGKNRTDYDDYVKSNNAAVNKKVETSAFETYKGEVTNALNDKVDKTTYDAYVKSNDEAVAAAKQAGDNAASTFDTWKEGSYATDKAALDKKAGKAKTTLTTTVSGDNSKNLVITKTNESSDTIADNYSFELKGLATTANLGAATDRIQTIENSYVKTVKYFNAVGSDGAGVTASADQMKNAVDLTTMVIDCGTY